MMSSLPWCSTSTTRSVPTTAPSSRRSRAAPARPRCAGSWPTHYERQRERIAGWILEAAGDGALEPPEARHIASLMLGTADGMLMQSFIDQEQVPSSQELAQAGAGALAAARDLPLPAPRS